MNRTLIVSELVQRSESLLRALTDTEDTEERLQRIETFLKERTPLLEELTSDEAWLVAARSTADMEHLKKLDIQIEAFIRKMMDETGGKLDIIKEEQSELFIKKKMNKGYSKPASSSEGYFIDKKK